MKNIFFIACGSNPKRKRLKLKIIFKIQIEMKKFAKRGRNEIQKNKIAED